MVERAAAGWGLTLRPCSGPVRELVVDAAGRWADPADVAPVQVIDTGGWWAVPGLADCHAHLSGPAGEPTPQGEEGEALVRTSAWAQLAGGVLLVADKGGRDDQVLRLLDAPPAERPDLACAGRFVAGPDGYFAGAAVETDEAGLAAAVRAEAARRGATWVKLIGDWPRKGVGAIPSFSETGLATAVAVAHQAGCRVAVHAAAPETSSLAVAAGVDSIEHGLFLTPDDLVALGRRRGAWVPTVAAMEAVAAALGPDSSGGRLFARGLANVRDLLAGAPALGVVVLAGTDTQLPHGGVATDAVKLVEYGLDRAEAVHAVSGAAYDHLGRPDGFARGRPADVVLFDRDPREDVAVLHRPRLVLRHGRVVVDRR